MEKINFTDINFESLVKSKFQGTNATIYKDGETCIKVLDGLYDNEKSSLLRKFEDMDGIIIPNVLLPKELIMKDGKLYGYTMNYFANSMPLSDKFLNRFVNCKELFEDVVKASKILRSIHNKDVIVQDLSFENILVDGKGSVAFCDLDGCSYRQHSSPFISLVLKEFYIDYRRQKVYLCKNLDRISMMISFILIVYGKYMQNLSEREYLTLTNEISTLENMEKYVRMLVNRRKEIEEIPYLDDVIDLNDDYIIDRNLPLSLTKKLKG